MHAAQHKIERMLLYKWADVVLTSDVVSNLNPKRYLQPVSVKLCQLKDALAHIIKFRVGRYVTIRSEFSMVGEA